MHELRPKFLSQWVLQLSFLCVSVGSGCSGTRVPEQFCKEDCVTQWVDECVDRCGITGPNSAMGTDALSGQEPGVSDTDDQPGGTSLTNTEPTSAAGSTPASGASPNGGANAGQNGEQSGDQSGGAASTPDTTTQNATPVPIECGKRCPDALCDKNTGMCQPCMGNEECPSDFNYCAEGRCNACLEDAHCEGQAEGKLYCASSTDNSCVECLEHAHCQSADRAQCGEDHTCIPCDADTQCGDGAPLCEGGVCGGCASDEDCARFGSDKGVCDTATGACVQCTEQSADSCCIDRGDNCVPTVCNSLTHTCSEALPQSANTCDPCVADGQCIAEHVCVQHPKFQNFDANSDQDEVAVEGHYCFPAMVSAGGVCHDTQNPFVDRVEDAVTVSGLQADFCRLRTSTCPAYTAHWNMQVCTSEDSADPTACGSPNAWDAFCDFFEASSDGSTQVYTCKMRCRLETECIVGERCINGRCEPL